MNLVTKSKSDVIEFDGFSTFNKKYNDIKANEKEEIFQAEVYFPWNENFLWNFSLIKEFFSTIKDKRWVMPLIHGYIN